MSENEKVTLCKEKIDQVDIFTSLRSIIGKDGVVKKLKVE